MADKAPNSNAVFTAQIVIMEEPWVRESIDTAADAYGLSRSELARRCLRAGLPIVTSELRDQRESIVKAAAVG